MNWHEEFYSLAEYYDIAFDFRDVPFECDFMEDIYKEINGKKPESFIEYAAGPAYHTVEFAKRKFNSSALDLSDHMVQYGLIKAKKNNTEISYFCENMVNFNIGKKFDIAAILMDSTSYFLDNNSFIDHLKCVSKHLNPGGIYILEMSHPRDVFNVGKSTGTDWEMNRDGKKVHIKWGDNDDLFDPISQTTDVTVVLDFEDESGKKGSITEKSKQRNFTVNEFKALVQLSGKFEVVHWFGSLDKSIPFDNDKKAWRMIPVLRII
ncbi:class I SAM-dependent methyltransferase [bacterium]|nr:class I SAM-dependent methyltransferase [bacterium]